MSKEPDLKKEIVKTEAFFVGKKLEKKMNLIKKSDLIFDKIAGDIDSGKNERAQKQREHRIAHRQLKKEGKDNHKGFYKFKLNDDNYEYEFIIKNDMPFSIILEDGQYLLGKNNVGYYFGPLVGLKNLLDSFYN